MVGGAGGPESKNPDDFARGWRMDVSKRSASRRPLRNPVLAVLALLPLLAGLHAGAEAAGNMDPDTAGLSFA
jgi:hypothetical protein